MAEELWHLSCLQHHGNERSNIAGRASACADPSKRASSSFLSATRSSAGGPTVGELQGQGWVAELLSFREGTE